MCMGCIWDVYGPAHSAVIRGGRAAPHVFAQRAHLREMRPTVLASLRESARSLLIAAVRRLEPALLSDQACLPANGDAARGVGQRVWGNTHGDRRLERGNRGRGAAG